MTILGVIQQGFIEGYAGLISLIPEQYAPILNLLIFSILISLYSLFTWKFYRSLSKKDLIQLDLGKYNSSSHKGLKKLFALILYLIEYIIILPFLIFFWLAILALIILVLSEQQDAKQVLTIAAAIVAAIRILSYYNEDLSKDLAKLFPFTILSIFILTPNFFNFPRIIESLSQIKGFLTSTFYFLIFIIVLELILRFLDLITGISRNKKDDAEEDAEEDTE